MKIDVCKRCNAAVFWVDTRKGKRVPLNVESIAGKPEPKLYDKQAGHQCHYDTCPKMERKPEPQREQLPTRPSSGGPRQSAEQEYRAQQSPPRTAAKEALDGKVQGEQTPDDYVPLEDDTF